MNVTADDEKADTVAEATSLACKMIEAAAERDPDTNVQMPLVLFSRIAQILHELAADQAPPSPRPAQEKQQAALDRIANLDIRGARELLELGAWKKIASELQAIAQEATNRPRAPFARPQ